jgi:TolA-binding protein
MSQHRRLIGLIIATLLAGCGTSGVRDADNIRIGSLKRLVLTPAPAVTPAVSRQDAMAQYEKFLANKTETSLRPAAMRRLADLYLDRGLQALIDGSASPAEPLARAIELYNELLSRYPDYPHNDLALYQLAHAYELNDKPELAMSALDTYADKFSDGDRIDEVQFRRGEYLFAQHDYAGAEQAYQVVLDKGDYFAFHQQALYKLGWSRLKLQNYRNAADTFLQLLDDSIRNHDSVEMPASLDAAGRERIEDALRGLSLCFASLGTSEAVEKSFRVHGNRKYEPLVYARLAELYLSKERYSDAASTYRRFASAHPAHRDAPLFESRAIAIYSKAGFRERLLEEKQAFVERYQPGSDYWNANKRNQDQQVTDQVQQYLHEITRYYHAVAQQKKTRTAFAEARHWYQFYLHAFPQQPQTAPVNFLYAELLTTAGDHGAAAREYERTAYDYGPHARAAEAGYAAVLAYEKHEAALTGGQLAVWRRAAIDSALKFATTFPDHPQATSVRLRAAQQLYALNEYEAAINAATPITLRPQASAGQQLSAWTVIAHARFDLHDYPAAETAYQQVLSRIGTANKRRPQLVDKLAACVYKQGERARQAGSTRDAVHDFLRVASVAPTSAIAATARFDAAALDISNNKFSEAIDILQAWRRDYPDHKLNDDVTRKLAVLYRDSGQNVQAAGEFERIAASASDPALKREASWTAATLYEQSKQPDRAISAYRNFVRTFPRPVEQAIEARAKLVELYGQQGDSASQNFWRKAIIRADSEAGAGRSDRTRFLAAQAQLALMGPALAAYQRITLKEPLQQNLALKKQFMQKAIDGYTRAAAYDVAEVTTAATYQIAELYLDFSKALMASERPHDLNGEELEQYDILLEEQAYPFEEKAIDIFETNVRHIASGIYDAAVRESLARLAEILPVRYAKKEKSEVFVEPR